MKTLEEYRKVDAESAYLKLGAYALTSAEHVSVFRELNAIHAEFEYIDGDSMHATVKGDAKEIIKLMRKLMDNFWVWNESEEVED